MKSELTTREKFKVTRFAIGIFALFVSYACLAVVPLSTLFGIGVGAGAAMTAGGSGHSTFSVFMLPLFIGGAAFVLAAFFGPGLIIRLLCIPSGVGYIAALLFLKKIG